MQYIVQSCHEVSQISLFVEITENTIKLEDYIKTQEKKLYEVITYLQTMWTQTIVSKLTEIFSAIGKGAFDQQTDSLFIYVNSKLWRILELIKQHMQSALRDMMKSSTEYYVKSLCSSCEILLDIPDDFEWTDDLITSPFATILRPIFSLALKLDANGANFSTSPINFQSSLVEIFETAVIDCHSIPTIEPFMLTRIFFDYINLRLSPTGFLDESIQNLEDHLKFCYKKASIPLYAYAKKFNQFIELQVLNIPEYVKHVKETKKFSSEIKEEIIRQIKLKEELERNLPFKIEIGPFDVNVNILKMKLIAKREDIIKKLLDMLCRNLKVDLFLISKQFPIPEILG